MRNPTPFSFFPRVIALCVLAICCVFPAHCSALRYTVDIPQLPDELSAVLSSLSDCVNLQQHPPDTRALLRTRMRNDAKSFEEVLKSKGYFLANIQTSLERVEEENATQDEEAVYAARFAIELGPRFTFAKPALLLEPDDNNLQFRLGFAMRSIAKGTPYDSELVLDTEERILQYLQYGGYPSPVMADRSVVADLDTRQVDVRYTVHPGRRAFFGKTEVRGLEGVDEAVVRRKIAWTEGALYDSRLVDKTREQLLRSGLFRSAQVDTNASRETVDMTLTLREAPFRTVHTGLWYYSDWGLGINPGWTHRNFFGGGQEFRTDTTLSERKQGVDTTLVLPAILHPAQTLSLSALYENENTDVYDAEKLRLSGILRRSFGEGITLGGGLAYHLIREDDGRRFRLFSVPLLADLDATSGNPLDPTSGLALGVRLEPFTSLENPDESFTLWSVTARHYLPLKRNRSIILASRARFSVLAGSGREHIPEDLLLYAGGDSSVRGYAYQYAGDLDKDGDPMGGIRAVDFSTELRFRFRENLGAVIFCDGGGAFNVSEPTDLDAYFWSVGAGFRYFTPIGPLRLDVAVPLNGRDGVDDWFQFYISLGQAF